MYLIMPQSAQPNLPYDTFHVHLPPSTFRIHFSKPAHNLFGDSCLYLMLFECSGKFYDYGGFMLLLCGNEASEEKLEDGVKIGG